MCNVVQKGLPKIKYLHKVHRKNLTANLSLSLYLLLIHLTRFLLREHRWPFYIFLTSCWKVVERTWERSRWRCCRCRGACPAGMAGCSQAAQSPRHRLAGAQNSATVNTSSSLSKNTQASLTLNSSKLNLYCKCSQESISIILGYKYSVYYKDYFIINLYDKIDKIQ